MPDRANIPIEDLHEDIIGKVIRGKGLGLPALASAAGISVAQIEALLDGAVDEAAIRAVAPHLDLDPDALVVSARKTWRPEPVGLDGLAMFNTAWGDMRVNAYVAWDPETKDAAVFDTGADATAMIDFIRSRGLAVKAIYLTHTHGDHIADLERLHRALSEPTIYVHRLEELRDFEAETIDHGHVDTLGNLALLALHTHGHSKGGTTYLITGLGRPVAIVGDSLFAGSILSLPDDTILCPGHGPLTSVAEEKAHNPFFPEFK
jgi:hydroxyacylglutathione hydrolase